jgi:alpha-tubulin suppressor-like RCC1 family protein
LIDSFSIEPTLLDTITDDKLEWIEIDFGGYHTAALTRKGDVFTWGNNGWGRLGHSDEESRRIPTKVAGLDGLFITKISCGRSYTAAITEKGEIFTWYAQQSW